jgi:hypothetical protein
MLLDLDAAVAAQAAAALVGLAATAAGARAILQPDRFAQSFGLPDGGPTTSPDENPTDLVKSPTAATDASHGGSTADPWIPAVGVRNVALGVSLVAFSLLASARTTGLLLLCNLVSMLGDTLVVYRFRQTPPSPVTSHLVASFVFAMLGGYMVRL